ncbi:hypothetical protein LEMLEM_LOCUS27054 [Lemmus lemmus]
MADSLVLSPPPVSHRAESWGVSRDVRLGLQWVELSCRHLVGLSGAASPAAYS